eukprot:Skav220436  [mRNA]  locus=scaffold2346:10436:17812:+ [translate_table: standard]
MQHNPFTPMRNRRLHTPRRTENGSAAMSLRPRCMTPWRCLWTVVLMAIHGASESRWQQLQPTGTAPTPRSWHTATELSEAQSPRLRSPQRKSSGSCSAPRAPRRLRGHRTPPCGAPGPAECWSSGAWTKAFAGSSARLPEAEPWEAQSPQLRSPERPPPVRGRGGWGRARQGPGLELVEVFLQTQHSFLGEALAAAPAHWRRADPAGRPHRGVARSAATADMAGSSARLPEAEASRRRVHS